VSEAADGGRPSPLDGVLEDGVIEADEDGAVDESADGGALVDGDEAPPETPDPAARRRRALIDWVIVIGVALLVAFLVRTFVLAHFVVDGTSMATTLHDGDRVFVNKLSYRLHDPHRGDVVVLHEINGTTDRDLIKRVIGLPGETIEMRNCDVTIDGKHLDEPYLDPQIVTPGNCGGDLQPTVVPKDHVFVMGDNRAGSLDSRNLGPIADKDLVGRAFVVFWPKSDWQWL
jgi:signal peptidase I